MKLPLVKHIGHCVSRDAEVSMARAWASNCMAITSNLIHRPLHFTRIFQTRKGVYFNSVHTLYMTDDTSVLMSGRSEFHVRFVDSSHDHSHLG